MLNEIYYYGKDSGGDVAANVRRQGKEWARAVSQVYLQFQKAEPLLDLIAPVRRRRRHRRGALAQAGAHAAGDALACLGHRSQTNKNAQRPTDGHFRQAVRPRPGEQGGPAA